MPNQKIKKSGKKSMGLIRMSNFEFFKILAVFAGMSHIWSILPRVEKGAFDGPKYATLSGS